MLATFFVDADNGSDSQSVGSIGQPFQTINRAIDFAQPGDTVWLREGVFREAANIDRAGTPGNPITFAAFNNESVTVTATDRLTGFVPTPDPTDDPNIYVATLDGSTSNSLLNRHELTVFVDGQLVQEAQSRNSADLMNVDSWDTFDTASTTFLVDNSRSVPFTNDLIGSVVRIRTNNYIVNTRRIASVTNNSLTVDEPFSLDPSGGGRYLLHDALALVDSPGEWYFEEETDQFYLWAPGGGDPDNLIVEVKRRAEAINTNDHDHLVFQDLRLTGGDFDLGNSSDVTIDGVHIIAPDRIFGPDFGTTRQSINIAGDNNRVVNSTFEYIWSAGVRLNGNNNVVGNNHFTKTAFNGGGVGGVAIAGNAAQNLVSYNTFEISGRGHIGQGDTGPRNIIEHNDFSRSNRITEDGGAVYYNAANLNNMVFRYNYFHDINNTFGSGLYLDNDSSDVAIHNNIFHNVGDNSGKFNLPNNFVLAFNNTYYREGNIDAFGQGSLDNTSFGSRFYNNIYSSIDSDLTSGQHPTDLAGNYDTGGANSGGSNFVNPGAANFSLTSGAGARDRGINIPGLVEDGDGQPDAGAVQFSESMFTVGHDFNNPPSAAELTYNYAPVIFSNRVENSSFEKGFSDYIVENGSPLLYSDSNSNYRAEGLARFGANAIQLNPGDGFSRTITGLSPDTAYTFSSLVQVIGEVFQAEDFNSTLPETTHRGLGVVGQLQNGNEVTFSGINFGKGSPLYNELQVGMSRSGTGTQVQVFLDNTGGPPIKTFNIDGTDNTELFHLTTESLPSITGTHSLIFRFNGSGNLGLFDEIRLQNTNTDDLVTVGVRDFHGSSVVSSPAGKLDAFSDRPKLDFRTGPESTSATVFFHNPTGSLFDGYVDSVAVAESALPDPVSVDINRTIYNYDVDVAFEPDIQNAAPQGVPYELLSPNVSGDVYWSGPVGAFSQGDPGGGINNLNRDFVTGSAPVTFNHRLQNGIYEVTLNLSSPYADLDNMQVRAEGQLLYSDLDHPIGTNPTLSMPVAVGDGELNLEFSDADSVDPQWVVNRINIRRTGDAPFVVDPETVQYQYDLGTTTSLIHTSDYERLTPTTTGDVFWTGGAITAEDRGVPPAPNNLNRDLIRSTSGQNATLNHKLPNGAWHVLVTLGDPTVARDNMGVRAEGDLKLSNIDRAAGEILNEGFDVTVLDGQLNLEFFDTGGVNPDWAVVRVNLTEIVRQPDLVGDFNGDLVVDAADFTVWRDHLGDSVKYFSDADANGNGIVDMGDYQLWVDNFGRDRIPTTLIDANTGNGSFEDWNDGGAGTRIIANSTTAAIPGWTALTTNVGGWLREHDPSATLGANSDGLAYAFAAGGASATFTSDPLSHTTGDGDTFTVSLDAGSQDGVENNYQLLLLFGGQERLVAEFTEGANVSTVGPVTHEFTYTAGADDAGNVPVVRIVAATNSSFSQTYLDNVMLSVLEPLGATETLPATTSGARLEENETYNRTSHFATIHAIDTAQSPRQWLMQPTNQPALVARAEQFPKSTPSAHRLPATSPSGRPVVDDVWGSLAEDEEPSDKETSPLPLAAFWRST